MATKIGTEFQVNTFTLNDQGDSSIASLTDGSFVIVWDSFGQDESFYRGVYGQRYDANGNPLGTEFPINTFTLDEQYDPSVASLTDGGFVVTWDSLGQDGSGNGIYGQRYDANSNPLGTEFRINTFTDSGQENSVVTSLNEGGFVVTWTSYEQDGSLGGIYGQRYDANGNPLGTEFRINTFTDSSQFDSSVASLIDGGFVVTWFSLGQNVNGSGNGIYGQRYDADGNPLGTEFLINTFTSDFPGNPAVVSLSNGGFVVTWDSLRLDGSGDSIYGQRYDANGNPLGTEFRINTSTDGTQRLPSVASLTNGGFVVTWTTFPESSNLNSNIYGQEYDANGNQVGSEFLVDANNNGTQDVSSVASLPNNKFVVTWDSNALEVSDYNVYGQIFGQVVPLSSVGVFEVEKLARSGFISDFSFDPIEINGLPLGSLYDETYYLSQNPDVAAAVNSGVFSDGYTHFIIFGGLEGRNPSSLYNEDFYLEQNPDVADAVAMGTLPSGSIHYALFGQQEGRSPSELFDEQAYRLNNLDVNDAITNGGLRSGFEHYLKFGKDEGRLPNNFLYNEAYYLSQNPDVAVGVNTGIFEDGFAHYIQDGQGERRNPSSLFNESQYLAINPDVANAVNSNLLTSGFEHYILYGRAENRSLF